MKYLECDVLVVGSGGAALRAAIAAKELNPALTVMILTKGQIGKSGVTAVACSDRMAFHATLKTTEPGGEDAWKYHADDVYRIGGKVSDKTLADVLAKNAAEAFEYLDELGVPFVKKNGIPDQFVTDGSDYARACYTGPRTANHIEEALVRRFQSLPIKSIEYAMAAELICQNGRVTGVVAVDTRIKDAEEAFFAIHSPAVILATGGGGLIYENNVFPGGMTGDGYGMAYVAGAKLVNMEFIQIGIASTKTKFNCSGSMMRSVPRLVNSDGVEFLSNYFPAETSAAEIANIVFKKGASWPVSYEHKTHIIDIALYKEWKAGRKTYLDYSQNPAGFSFDMLTEENQARYRREMNLDLGIEKRNLSPLERLREINQPSIDWFAEYGIHLDKGDMIQVAACAQHFQGGVKIDKQGRTSVHGLWAVGETAGGQHGANRPGGNALLDCQVFGKLAGQDAAHTVGGKHALSAEAKVEWAQQAHTMAMVIESQLGNAPKGALPATSFRRALQSALEGSSGIVRTSEGLRRGMNELKKIREQGMQLDEKGPAYYMENVNMLTTAEMVLAAAMLRDESRGPHLRFAKFEDNTPIARKEGAWEKYIVIHKGAGGMEIHVDSPEV